MGTILLSEKTKCETLALLLQVKQLKDDLEKTLQQLYGHQVTARLTVRSVPFVIREDLKLKERGGKERFTLHTLEDEKTGDIYLLNAGGLRKYSSNPADDDLFIYFQHVASL